MSSIVISGPLVQSSENAEALVSLNKAFWAEHGFICTDVNYRDDESIEMIFVAAEESDDGFRGPNCSVREFEDLARRYKNGDPNIWPADDPEYLLKGFLVKDGEQEKLFSILLSELKEDLAAGESDD